jgi:hypothetical protein
MVLEKTTEGDFLRSSDVKAFRKNVLVFLSLQIAFLKNLVGGLKRSLYMAACGTNTSKTWPVLKKRTTNTILSTPAFQKISKPLSTAALSTRYCLSNLIAI